LPVSVSTLKLNPLHLKVTEHGKINFLKKAKSTLVSARGVLRKYCCPPTTPLFRSSAREGRGNNAFKSAAEVKRGEKMQQTVVVVALNFSQKKKRESESEHTHMQAGSREGKWFDDNN
jgi:hypothetical protein